MPVRRPYLWAVPLLLLVLGGVAAWVLLAAEPRRSGAIAVPGLHAPVVIEREARGVVHVRAGDRHDLFFAQGYVHAQDRLWQMEFQRRVGAGRLAQVLGAAALEQDRFLRTWGFLRAARAAYAALDAEERAAVDAYRDGINAFLAGEPPLPPEFRLLGFEPAPWRGEDVLVWVKMMAFDLARNRRAELRRRALLANGVSPRRILELMPVYPADRERALHQYVPAAPDTAAGRQAAALEATDPRPPLSTAASNGWVVAGAHTAGGAPLLANDPHLTLRAPALWYVMHLSAPGYEAIGATLPGIPAVAIGRNRAIAWGATNLTADVEDLYVLEENAAGDAYRYRGEWRPYHAREEVIAVADADPVRIRVRETVHGPVISDVVETPDAAPLALRWSGHEPDHTVAGFIGINTARDWESFLAGLARMGAPAQSFVYADRAGHIGRAAAGRIPLRRPGHSGQYPMPGDGTWDWQGFLPFGKMPRTFDPADGRLVSANDRAVPAGYPHLITLDWGTPFRAERITTRLAAASDWDLADSATLQLDTYSALAEGLEPVLRRLQPATADARRWRDRLLAWDRYLDADSEEASLLQAWYLELAQLPVAETGGASWWMRPRFLLRAFTRGDAACAPDCDGYAAMALSRALDRLGPPRPWGELHRATFPHAVLTHTPLRALSDRHVAAGGDHFTVNVGGYRSETFDMHHGASYRQLIDLARPEQSLFVYPMGQSGNPLSGHYDDLLPLWRRGEYLPMRMDAYAVEERLELVPVSGASAARDPNR